VYRGRPLAELPPEVKAQVVAVIDVKINRFLQAKVNDGFDPDKCDPDQSVALVTKAYKPAYVLNQLLNWHKGGVCVLPPPPQPPPPTPPQPPL
jgi:hypothetical protein